MATLGAFSEAKSRVPLTPPLPYVPLRLNFRPHRLGDLLRRAFPLLFLAPFPLRQIIIALLQSTLAGQLIDALQELWGKRQGYFVHTVVSFDLSGNFLPIEDPVAAHLA